MEWEPSPGERLLQAGGQEVRTGAGALAGNVLSSEKMGLPGVIPNRKGGWLDVLTYGLPTELAHTPFRGSETDARLASKLPPTLQ